MEWRIRQTVMHGGSLRSDVEGGVGMNARGEEARGGKRR